MATKKSKENTKLQAIFDLCPHFNKSEFELSNFSVSTGVSYPRFVIDTVNRLRKVDSDLETEKRTFERNVLLEEKKQLEEFLESQDASKVETALKNWQSVEQEYWVNYLGKIAAIEILTFGKPSLETMDKMVKLPEDAYVVATQVCVRLANAIREATVKAEEAVGVFTEQPTADSAPKKLVLKKVK
jgi:hypothetical protein